MLRARLVPTRWGVFHIGGRWGATKPLVRMAPNFTESELRRILVLAGARRRDPHLVEALAGHGEILVATSGDEAAGALRHGAVDLVVGAYSEMAALAQAVSDHQTRGLFETVGQPICIVDREGTLIWANAKLASLDAAVRDAIREASGAEAAAMHNGSVDPRAPRRRTLDVSRDQRFELTLSPVLGTGGDLSGVVALAWDMSATRRLQEKINAIDSAGRELVDLDIEAIRKLDVEERLKLLEDKIVTYCHDLLHFDHFAIRVLNTRDNRLDTVLAAGLTEDAKKLEIYAKSDGNGISGYVGATGRTYVCADVTKDARYLPGLDNARSTLTTPLKLHDRVIGILNVESEQVNAFTEQDVQIAEIFSRYVAMALHILQLLISERNTTTGQIAADVDAEIAAPLNTIVHDLTELIRGTGHDELMRTRLEAVLKQVDRVRDAIHSVTAPAGVSGLAPETPQRDPIIGGKRILIADDEDIIRETIADVLSKHGAIAVMAGDGLEAVELVGRQRFDLVLSDIKMPNKNGYELFAAARAARRECPVILITGFGYDPNHSIVRASREGLNGVLFKPFKVEVLLNEVRRAISSGAPK